MKTLQRRASSDVKRKIWEGRVNKNLLLKLFNLQNVVYPYVYGRVDLKEENEEFKKQIKQGNIFGVSKNDNPLEVIAYYNLLKRELIDLLKSPEIHLTDFEMIKILACLNILCSDIKELKIILRPYVKDKKLHTYINILGIYDENAMLISEYMVKNGRIDGYDALVTKVAQFVKDFETSEK